MLKCSPKYLVGLLLLTLIFFTTNTAQASIAKKRTARKNPTVSTTRKKARRAKAPRTPSASKLSNLHPQAKTRVNAALRDLRRLGVRPVITSGYRSTAQQRAMYRCAKRNRCRGRRGIYGARKPGTSLHEAGLAVDVANVAVGKKRNRRLTRNGSRIVKVMRKHGFKWRYGLKDPAHFEVDPRTAGFKSEKAAIKKAQRRAGRQYSRKAKIRGRKHTQSSGRRA